MLSRLLAWGKASPDVRALLAVGSRAREDHPADEWSDWDLIVVMQDPDRCLSTGDWLEPIGLIWFTFVERTASGQGNERRVLFEGGMDVDFIPVAADAFAQAVQKPPLVHILRGGVRVLLDKDGIASQLVPPPAAPAQPPTQSQFSELVSDFWFHAAWTAKKLRRGELWVAKSCCDGYMKRLLLQMIEWHARAQNGWGEGAWYGGRFLEQWADPRAVEGLRHAFARYDPEDVWRALSGTLDLFRWIAIEIAERLSYPYPHAAEERVSQWVAHCRSQE
jgi:aminoglycoside 6-adenylyltransferase